MICEAGAGGGGTWNENDVIIFSPESGIRTGLWRVSASGGTATPITTPEEGLRIHAWPHFLPDGERFIYVRSGGPDPGIYVGRLDSRDPHSLVLPITRTSPDATTTGGTADRVFRTTKAVVAGDVLFFLQERTLVAQRFDVARLAPAGEPIRVADNVVVGTPGLAAFDASPAGVVTYRQPTSAQPVQLTWVDRSGKTIGPLGDPGPYVTVSISPDGLFALANWWDERGRPASGTVTRIDLGTGAATPLFTNVAALDGRTPARALANFGAQAHATDWLRDGRFIVGVALNAETRADIWIMDADGREPIRYLVREPFHQQEPRISPDGR